MPPIFTDCTDEYLGDCILKAFPWEIHRY